MPKFARQPRHKRMDDAPRIETGACVKAMSRRIEASVSRDGLFGLVTWNYLFRSSVNLSHSLYPYEKKMLPLQRANLRRNHSKRVP